MSIQYLKNGFLTKHKNIFVVKNVCNMQQIEYYVTKHDFQLLSSANCLFMKIEWPDLVESQN